MVASQERLPCTIRSFAAAPSSMAPARPLSQATSRSRAAASPRSAASRVPARREIDAAGLLVTPGWVDVHTHYDGQAMWDPLLAPSCWHGVTTVLFGNCGVGFAPVKKHHRGALMDLMEGVEEIPESGAGRRADLGVGDASPNSWMRWSAGRAPSISRRRPRTLPLRVYVMGDRAVRREAGDARRHRRDAPPHHRSHASPAPSASPPRAPIRTRRRTANWWRRATPTPTSWSASARRSAPSACGAFGMNSDFDDEDYELAWMTRLARQTGRPIWFLLTDRYEDPAALAAAAEGDACGARRRPVVHGADRRPADRRDDGYRHRAQSVHGAAEL